MMAHSFDLKPAIATARANAAAAGFSAPALTNAVLGGGLLALAAIAWREGETLSALARAGAESAFCGIALTHGGPLLFGHCPLCYAAGALALAGLSLLAPKRAG